MDEVQDETSDMSIRTCLSMDPEITWKYRKLTDTSHQVQTIG
jgi:hypothetical protein